MHTIKPISAILILGVLSLQGFGQGYAEKFIRLSNAGDTAGERQLIKEWQQKKPEDPELFVAGFNYYVQKSRTHILALENSPSDTNSIQLTSEKNGDTVAYMNEETVYEPQNLKLALSCIDQGIQKFPNRLDMRFGKIYLLGQVGDYPSYTREIRQTIERSHLNKNDWYWSGNQPVKTPEKFMLNTVQSYVVKLYNLGDSQSANIRSISRAVLKYYPDHVESLSDLAISYIIKNEYTQALTYLLKAERIAPSDCIVLGNIAYAYSQQSDKKNALSYYEKMIRYGNADDKAFARQQIASLKKQ